jgi:hypothetical protein
MFCHFLYSRVFLVHIFIYHIHLFSNPSVHTGPKSKQYHTSGTTQSCQMSPWNTSKNFGLHIKLCYDLNLSYTENIYQNARFK